jgi:hypothetical protein
MILLMSPSPEDQGHDRRFAGAIHPERAGAARILWMQCGVGNSNIVSALFLRRGLFAERTPLPRARGLADHKFFAAPE